MANQPIAPARRLVAAIIGTVAVFVVVFGLGMSSWAVVVLGLAVLALAIALGVVNVVRRSSRAWVAGTAQVKAVSDPPASTAYGRAELQIVVVAPGLPITEVLVRDPRVPVSKWPRLGETLPVMVDVEDMRRVRIDWPNAPDIADPPPPGQSYSDLPATEDPLDEYDDDLLGPLPPPPWAGGAQWTPEDASPTSPPPPPAGDAADGPRTIDGEVVGPGEPAAPLPRRGSRPSPRPRSGAATATVEPETIPDDDTAATYAPSASSSFAPSASGASDSSVPSTSASSPHSPAQSSPPPPPATASGAEAEPEAADAGDAADAAELSATGATAASAPGQATAASAPGQATAASAPGQATAASVRSGATAASAWAEPPADSPAAASASTPVDDDIDVPLDPHPPAPNTVTPPPADVPRFVPPPREKPAAETDAAPTVTMSHSSNPTPANPNSSGSSSSRPAPTIPAQSTDHADDAPVISGPDVPMAAAAGSGGAGPWADLEGGGYEPDDRADEVITGYPSARPGPAGAIHGVGLTVLVTDLPRAVAFYRDTLGFYEIDKGEGNAVLASGDTRLVLRTVGSLSSAGRLVYLNLEVGDIEATYRELVAKGVTFEHPPQVVNHGERLELWSATFHDPDGHNIAITQWRSTSRAG